MASAEQQIFGRAVEHAGPEVSVIIPAYNVAPFIYETLASVFAQTFTDYEVILINDGSPDTVELERKIASYRDRVVYLVQENRGAASARNHGLRRARGRVVAFLDGDDFWEPHYLAEQLAFLRCAPHKDLVYCDAFLFGKSQPAARRFMELSPSRGEVTFTSLLSLQCSVIMSGVVARKQPILDVGLLDENLRNSHDFDLWLRLTRRGAQFAYQKKVLLHHRCHPHSLSGDAINRAERVLRVLKKVARYDDLTPAEREVLSNTVTATKAQLELEKGKFHLARGSFMQAMDSFRRANKVKRSRKLSAVIFMLYTAPRLLLKIYERREKKILTTAH